jgi:uncharacterized protein (DUF2267 family)
VHNVGELYNHVEEQTGLPRPLIERATEAVLLELHHRIGPEAAHLQSQLPHDVAKVFAGGIYERVADAIAPAERFGMRELVGRVARDGGIDRQHAEQVTQAVFHELKAHVTEGQARHVAAALPRDIEAVWDQA